MKRLFAIAALALSAAIAHAGPVEDLLAAMKSEQSRINSNEKERAQGVGQSVIRGYLATKNGMTQVNSGTTYLGGYVSRADVAAATAQLGMTQSSTLGGLVDVYVARPGTQYAGFMVLSWSDSAGNANEIYLMNVALP